VCFEASDRPPLPPRTGHLGSSERLTLRAEDGTEVAARLATTDEPASPGVVLLPDVRGLHPYYEDLAERFADAGVHALAIDHYSRTAGTGWRDADFDNQPHRGQVADAHSRMDVRAAADALRRAGATSVYALGFCKGGRAAFMQASEEGIAGVVGLYGWPTREEDGRSPVTEAREGRVQARVLALYGGADQGITAEDRDAYEQALTEAGVTHETVVYPDAPHSYFDRKMVDHADACADTWRRALAFMGVSA
jgi:carboxymethylenebutenolidase